MTYKFYNSVFLSHGLDLSPDTEAATADQILPLVKCELGLAFLPQNADSLTETIERFLLLAPEERAEMGRQARAYVEAHFDRRQVVTEYLETLGSLIEATRC